MGIAKDLRDSVLQAAIQGKLSERSKEDILIKDIINDVKLAETELPFDIPESWCVIELRNICITDISYGIIKLGKEDENGIKVLRCSDVKRNYIDISKVRTVTKELSDKYSRTLLNGNEIVINVRGTLGGCSVVPKSLKGYNVAREVAVIRLVEKINPQYIVNLLLSPYFNEFMTDNLRGIAYKGLNMGKLSKLNVPLPPIEEQQRIVDRVDELMNEIDELENIETELETLKKKFPEDMKASLLQAAMQGKLTRQLPEDGSVRELLEKIGVKPICSKDGLFDIPENWKWCKIKDACSYISTGNSIPESVKKEKYSKIRIGHKYIGTKDVEFNSSIKYDNGIVIPYSEEKFRIAKSGSTLLCIEGGSAGKKVAMVDKDVCYGNKLCAFTGNEIANNEFIYYWLQNPTFLQEFFSNMTGMIGGVNQKKLKEIAIPIPPIAEQQRIVAILEEMIPLCDDLR